MNQQQYEALNAAMLAKMVGVEMQKVDGLTVERGSNPANKIDINRFIAPIKGGSPQHIPNEANMGYVPESMVQTLIPDTPTNNTPPITVGLVQPVQQPVQQLNVAASNEDLKSIKSLLERINSNLTKLTGMFGKIYCTTLEKEKSCKNVK